MVCSVFAPSPVDPVQPSFLNTSFLVQPPAQFQFQEMVDSYGAIGVTSMVTVAMYDQYDTYNVDSCSGTATLASSRNIVVKEQILVYDNYTQTDLQRVIRRIQTQYNPDSILWCDWSACVFNQKMHPLPAFKSDNYLPKALALLDCIDQPGVSLLPWQSSTTPLLDSLSTMEHCSLISSTFYSLIFRSR